MDRSLCRTLGTPGEPPGPLCADIHSGVDATVADEAQYLSHIFGLRSKDADRVPSLGTDSTRSSSNGSSHIRLKSLTPDTTDSSGDLSRSKVPNMERDPNQPLLKSAMKHSDGLVSPSCVLCRRLTLRSRAF